MLKVDDMKRTVAIALISFIFFSCNMSGKPQESDDKKKDKIADSKASSKINFKDDIFKIVLKGIFLKDDLILVFYSKGEEEITSMSNKIKINIKGSTSLQKITFLFPKGVRPDNIRIDFSGNKDQKEVLLKELLFVDTINKIVINKSNLNAYFDYNKMSFVQKTGVLKGEIFQLNGKEEYNPYFMANLKFTAILKKFNQAYLNKTKKVFIEGLANLNLEDGRFRILIKGVFKSDDLLLLYYTEDSLEKFDIKKSISKEIKGSNQEQTVIFMLPKGHFAIKIQLDISDRKTQKGIEISSIIISELKNKTKIEKNDLSKYFLPNNYIDFDKETGDFICKIIKENHLEKYNPFFLGSPRLIKELLEF